MADIYSDLFSTSVVLSGLTVTAGRGRAVTVAPGVAYIISAPGGSREQLFNTTSFNFGPSLTEYLDWNGQQFAATAASSPAVGYVRLAQVVTGASTITSVTDLRPTVMQFLANLPALQTGAATLTIDSHGHLKVAGGTAPTVTTQGDPTVIGSTGAGSIQSGTDASFIVKLIVSGTAPITAGLAFVLTYGAAHSGIPQIACTIDLPSTSSALQNVNVVTGGAGTTLSVLCSNVLSVGTYYFHFNVQQN